MLKNIYVYLNKTIIFLKLKLSLKHDILVSEIFFLKRDV